MKYTKIIISLFFATLFSSHVTASLVADSDGEENVGNWTKTFILKDGRTDIKHTPDWVITMGGMMTSRSLSMKSKSLNGMPMDPAGLHVSANMSEKTFVEALVASGLYSE